MDTKTLISPDDYLAFEDTATERHEYVDGVVYTMPGETLEHNEVAGALYARLRSASRERNCRVAFEGVKLHLPHLNRYYYPDVMLLSDPRDQGPLLFRYPCFVAEVASPSSEATDRREKLLAYKSIDTLQGYLMLDPLERSADYLERNEDGWQVRHLRDDIFTVPCLDLELDVATLF
jgi:Uma2 family endonuclease